MIPSLTQRRLLAFNLAAAALASLLITHELGAETWTDVSGKFRVEAEYVGVEGKEVVLRRANNTTVRVPISRLSEASRAQAKRFYDLAKSESKPASPVTPVSPPNTKLDRPSDEAPLTARLAMASSQRPKPNFTPPEPLAVGPMATFPENASLQETVDFVRTQLLAGHPEVFWQALPAELREKFDSQEVRDLTVAMTKDQIEVTKSLEAAWLKALEVLITKKSFVLNSQMMAAVPPQFAPMVKQAYDPAVGLAHELMNLSFSVDSLSTQTVTSWFDEHGPRIGGHLQALVALAPPGMIDQLLNQMVVEQTNDSSGTITITNFQGQSQRVEMVAYGGRWLPRSFAEKWDTKKDELVTELTEQMNQAKQQKPNIAQQSAVMSGMITGFVDRGLDPLRNATTQAEFDQAVTELAAVMSLLQRGGAREPSRRVPRSNEIGRGGTYARCYTQVDLASPEG